MYLPISSILTYTIIPIIRGIQKVLHLLDMIQTLSYMKAHLKHVIEIYVTPIKMIFAILTD